MPSPSNASCSRNLGRMRSSPVADGCAGQLDSWCSLTRCGCCASRQCKRGSEKSRAALKRCIDSRAMGWQPNTSGACAPDVYHWHIRKCAGTTIRNVLKRKNASQPYGIYREYHHASGAPDWSNLAKLEATARQEANAAGRQSCGARRLVVLREPYEQFRSEVHYFPRDFYRVDHQTRQARLVYGDNHLICRGMGLCAASNGFGRGCSVERAMRVLAGFDFIGFFSRLDIVFEVLRGWTACGGPPLSRTESALDRLASKGRLEVLLRSGDTTRSGSNYTAAILASIDKLHRAWNGSKIGTELGRAEERLSNLTLEAMRLMPLRAEFEARNGCAVEVYRRALLEYGGPRGGPWPPRACT